MTLLDVIETAKSIRPSTFSGALLTQWVNEAEGMVQTEVMKRAPENCVTYDYGRDSGRELLVRAPHDKLYYAYICAMIDFANGEYSSYQNTMNLFNARLAEYAKWYIRNPGG